MCEIDGKSNRIECSHKKQGRLTTHNEDGDCVENQSGGMSPSYREMREAERRA